jgi:integrase
VCTVKHLYDRWFLHKDGKLSVPAEPLLYVPTHPGREMEKDLKDAGIEKTTAEGKVDFHAYRTAYTTFVVESGANVKEAQTLLRHSSPDITMNVYARTREDRLVELAERIGIAALGQKSVH